MTTQRAWESFPPTYRAEEMRTLAHWILDGKSGSVVGLPGCGRSNLLDFLSHRPKVLQSYLPQEAAPVALIPVDLNNLPANDPATVYRVILRSFYWVRDRLDSSLIETVTSLYLENRTTQDSFLSQSALYELLFAFQAERTQVALILNRFDRFCQVATPQMLNTLRGLRDSFKETLCFIVGMRQEIAYLPDTKALGDMYELLDSRVCWVGAMNETDARQVIARRTAPTSPPETEVKMILDLAGGFPVLLSAIGYWWVETTDRPPINKWLSTLIEDRAFDYRLARLWGGLTQEEQFACAAVREWQEQVVEADEKKQSLAKVFDALIEGHKHALSRLEAKGICRWTETGWQIRGELMFNFIKRVGPSSRGLIRIDEKTEDIYQGLDLLPSLPPQEDVLFRFLIKNPRERHSYSRLVDQVFAEELITVEGEKHIERDRHDLFPLIKNLRRKIEVDSSNPRYIINYRSKPEGGYKFYPEGCPE